MQQHTLDNSVPAGQSVCQTIRRIGEWTGPSDLVELSYDERFLRRKIITTASGLRVLVDLEHTVSMNEGDAFVLSDDRFVRVVAAQEALLQVTGPDLPRLAWHIGNRHTPCQIESDRLLIQRDHVIRAMLEQIGASLVETAERFTPEGGAYGHGRTHGHSH